MVGDWDLVWLGDTWGVFGFGGDGVGTINGMDAPPAGEHVGVDTVGVGEGSVGLEVCSIYSQLGYKLEKS